MRNLFVAWQSPTERSWHTVGRLASIEGHYRFEYTRGAETARKSGFTPFSAFPDLFVAYESERLFPFFANRLLSRGRREYADFVKWVSHHETIDDPVVLLAQSGGTRMTDSLELFPRPELDSSGHYHIHFFTHGLSQMPASAAKRAEELREGEQLLIMKDVQNPVDSFALMLRTAGAYEHDVFFMGYVPRYLSQDLSGVLELTGYARVRVLRVNMPPAPIQFRVLCCFQIRQPPDVHLFAGDEFLPVSAPRSLTGRERRKASR